VPSKRESESDARWEVGGTAPSGKEDTAARSTSHQQAGSGQHIYIISQQSLDSYTEQQQPSGSAGCSFCAQLSQLAVDKRHNIPMMDAVRFLPPRQAHQPVGNE